MPPANRRAMPAQRFRATTVLNPFPCCECLANRRGERRIIADEERFAVLNNHVRTTAVSTAPALLVQYVDCPRTVCTAPNSGVAIKEQPSMLFLGVQGQAPRRQ